MPPLISVIIPIYNHAGFIPEAMQTVAEQHYASVEVIVVDDGSSDDGAAIAARLGARVVSQPNGGPASARNRGLQEINGDFIQFLDVDDLLPAGKWALQLARFAQQPSLDIVTGHYQAVMMPGADERNLFTQSMPIPGMNLGSALIRRSVFNRIGVFDTLRLLSDDVDWFHRALEADLNIVILNAVTLFFRQHPHNTTRQAKREALRDELARCMMNSVRRRRTPDGIRPLRDWFSLVEPES